MIINTYMGQKKVLADFIYGGIFKKIKKEQSHIAFVYME